MAEDEALLGGRDTEERRAPLAGQLFRLWKLGIGLSGGRCGQLWPGKQS